MQYRQRKTLVMNLHLILKIPIVGGRNYQENNRQPYTACFFQAKNNYNK